jgi:hypothetical protein
MRKILLSILLVFACSFSFFAQSNVTKEDYTVYSSVLRNIRLEALKESKTKFSFVILDDTSSNLNIFDEYTAKRFRGLLRDFKRKNRTSSKLEKLFRVQYKYEITNQSKIDELLKIGSKEFKRIEAEYKARNIVIGMGIGDIIWEPFYEKYPNANGYYQFSRVGFSADKRFALVLVEGKGGSWDSQMQYILREVKGRWTIYQSSGSFTIE